MNLLLSSETPVSDMAGVVAADVETFMGDDSMCLNDVIEQYMKNGMDKTQVGLILPAFQRALERERSENAAIAAVTQFSSNVRPLVAPPFNGAGQRVVSAANSMEKQA